MSISAAGPRHFLDLSVVSAGDLRAILNDAGDSLSPLIDIAHGSAAMSSAVYEYDSVPVGSETTTRSPGRSAARLNRSFT